MKRILLLLALFAAIAATAQTVEKETFVYSVQGRDTLRMDRYVAMSPSSTPKPCMLFVFGGGFVSGQRDIKSYTPYFEYYAQQGYVVASIDYRLGLKMAMSTGPLNEQTFPMAWIQTLAMAVEDLYDATAYVLKNAAEWGVDPKAIVASGSSAGAITVLMGEYGICNSNMLSKKLPQDFNYAGLISYAGAIFDMSDELKWEKTPAPMLLFHGDADRNVPYDVIRYENNGFFGSKYIAAQLTRNRVPHCFYSVTNTDHVMAVRPMTDNRYEIDMFLEKLVKNRERIIIDTHVTPMDAPDIPKVFSLSDYLDANFGN